MMTSQFLIKNTMADMRGLSACEIMALQSGCYAGVELLGYYEKGDTPAPIIYFLSTTLLDDDGGSIIQTGDIKLEHQFIGELNVRYFGAKGDGLHDDTSALQKTIDYAPINSEDTIAISPKGFANGFNIQIPRGRYKITDTIILKRGLNIKGASLESTQLLSFLPGSVIKYSDDGRYIQDEIKISDLSIWQDASVPATNGAAIMLDFGSTTVYSMKLMVKNIYIEGTYDGITAVALVGSSMKNVFISKCVRHGIYVPMAIGNKSTSSTSFTLYNCYTSSNGGDGVRIINGAYISLVGCASDSNTGYGYYVQEGLGHSLFSCGCEENKSGNIFLSKCQGITLNVTSLFSEVNGEIHGITIHQSHNVNIAGLARAIGGNTGYAVSISLNGGMVDLSNLSSEGLWQTKRINTGVLVRDLKSALVCRDGQFALNGNTVQAGKLLSIVGFLPESIKTSVENIASFSKADSTRNVNHFVQSIVSDNNESYPLLVSNYTGVAVKGNSATVQKFAANYIVESNIGSAANANMMIDAQSGTVPSGNWNIYSESQRKSYFRGPLVLGSNNGSEIMGGNGCPEGIVSARVGSIYINSAGASSLDSIFVKDSGSGNVGWVSLVPMRQAAAAVNSATDPGAVYTQSEILAILSELRDLKTKLRSAGVLAV